MSSWWYRERGWIIGAFYGLGFLVTFLPLPGLITEPAAAVWGAHWGLWGIYGLFWAGVLLGLFGWLMRLLGSAYLRGEIVFAPDVQSDRLVVAGPFRFTRNPLYFGNDLLALGIGLFASPLGFAIIVLGNFIFGALLAGEEGQGLSHHYGADYEAYRRAVPPFLPRLTPVAAGADANVTPSWRSAFFAELFSFAMVDALLPISIFGHAGLGATEFIASVAVLLFLYTGRMGRRQTS
jgi:protein-S-isoprenylcysteine O-methyltransferase Ste14